MKHKYVLSKNDSNGELLIREYAELSKDIFSPVCESIYDANKLKSAMISGNETVLEIMRTLNFYPPGGFSEKIVLSVSKLLSSEGSDQVEIYCDDTEFLTTSLSGQDTFEKIDEEENGSLDNFIEDDLPNGFGDDVKSKKVGASVDIEENDLDDEDG